MTYTEEQQTLRLTTGETVRKTSLYYGEHLVYVPYEDGINVGFMDYFEINPTLPKVPNKLWNKLMSVFYDYANQNLEVHARIVYDEWRNHWKVVVPYQEVTSGSASYNYSLSIDLETGKQLNYPVDLPTYEIIWHIHSHNTMNLKHPSSIDDKDELETKQGYCVISNIDLTTGTYVCCFTVVSNNNKQKTNKRYFIVDSDVDKIVEGLCNQNDCTLFYEQYHQNVNNVINRWIPPAVKQPTYTYSWLPKGKKKDFDWKSTQSISARTWNVDDEVRELILLFGVDEVVAAVNKYVK